MFELSRVYVGHTGPVSLSASGKCGGYCPSVTGQGTFVPLSLVLLLAHGVTHLRVATKATDDHKLLKHKRPPAVREPRLR